MTTVQRAEKLQELLTFLLLAAGAACELPEEDLGLMCLVSGAREMCSAKLNAALGPSPVQPAQPSKGGA